MQRKRLTTNKRRTRGSQVFQGNRLPNHSCAASREAHLSRRTEVASTAKFMDAMRSSTCALNSARVTIVGSMSRMAA